MNLIYGLSPVLEALRARRRPLQKLLLASGVQPARLQELINRADRNLHQEKCGLYRHRRNSCFSRR
jgi:tRNA G18 (ribose-2'-O)-methylase SpoU